MNKYFGMLKSTTNTLSQIGFMKVIFPLLVLGLLFLVFYSAQGIQKKELTFMAFNRGMYSSVANPESMKMHFSGYGAFAMGGS